MVSPKQQFRPTRATGGVLVSLFVCMLACSAWSRALYHKRGDTLGFLAIASVSVLLGHFVYAVLTAVPIAVRRLKQRGGGRAVPRPPERDGEYTVRSILLAAFDVHADRGLPHWSVSRLRFWTLVHPFALGLFVVTLVLPGYDAGCNVAFCAGLNALGAYEELQRGRLWKRARARNVMLAVACVLGIVVNALEFALSYMAVAHAGDEDPYLDATMLGNLLAAPNQTTTALVGNHSVIVLDRDELAYYLERATASTLRVRMLLWTMCFFGPCLLQTALHAGAAALSESVELARPGVNALAGLVLAMVVLTGRARDTDMLYIDSALASLYLLFSVFVVVPAAVLLLRLLTQRRCLYASCVLQLECIALLLVHGGLSLELPLVQHCFTALVTTAALYLAAVVVFVRAENTAHRGGWGAHLRNPLPSSGDDDDDGDFGASPGNYTIDEILSAVEGEVENNEERVLIAPVAARADDDHQDADSATARDVT